MTQYLILHKVRGQPSFDCAEEIEPDMWITNSGYRAYPYLKWALTELEGDVGQGYFASVSTEIPTDWPDHFEVRGERVERKIDMGDLLARMLPPIRRRI